MRKKYTTLLFDLDGTLVDSGEGITKCAQYALAHFGIQIEDYHTLRFFVGPPLEDSFKDFYGFSSEQATEAVATYRERYFQKGIYEQAPYPGVTGFLQTLRDRGYTMAVATSKVQLQAERVVNELFPQLSPYFDHIFARDNACTLHTKADVINHGLEVMGITDRSGVLMIGDRKFDILGAKECHIDSMGVLYGFGSREEFEAAGADYICKDYDEMLHLLH